MRAVLLIGRAAVCAVAIICATVLASNTGDLKAFYVVALGSLFAALLGISMLKDDETPTDSPDKPAT